MIQFIAVMLHAFQLLISNPCNFPTAFVWLIGLHAVMFFFLFKNFFDQAYKKVNQIEKIINELKFIKQKLFFKDVIKMN